MKDSISTNQIAPIIISAFIITPITLTVLCYILTENYECFYALFVPLLAMLFLFLIRKLAFSKIEIDELGIKKTYHKKIIANLTWEEVKVVKAFPSYCLLFLEKDKSRSEAANSFRENICIDLTNKNIKVIEKYKAKFRDKITDISILSARHKKILLE